MRKVAILTVAAAIVLTACGTGDGQARSLGAGGDATSGISVAGRGEVTGTPDTLTVSLGVNVVRDSVNEATNDAADLTSALIAAITGLGVDEKDVQTADYSIWPRYEYRNGKDFIIGYQVNSTLTVKVRDVAKAGDVIDTAASVGGDDAVVSGVSFSIEDNEEMLELARAAAWADAEAKAAQLARLAGVDLGAPVTITETLGYQTPPIYYEERFTAADGAGTPIAPGTQSVTVDLQVTFAIGG